MIDPTWEYRESKNAKGCNLFSRGKILGCALELSYHQVL